MCGLCPRRYPPDKGLEPLGAATGLRPGELFGLQLRHVNLLHATVSAEQQIQQTAKHGVKLGPPTTARSHCTVPLPRVAVDAMKAPTCRTSPPMAPKAGSSRAARRTRGPHAFMDGT